MQQYLLMCKSLTYAQRASRVLERAGITATVTRAPQTAVGSGCSYCVKVSERRLQDARNTLGSWGLPPNKIFRVNPNGTVSEVGR